MRTIASTSGAEITGITINDYQVKRGEYHNGKVHFLFGRPSLLRDGDQVLISSFSSMNKFAGSGHNRIKVIDLSVAVIFYSTGLPKFYTFVLSPQAIEDLYA